MTQLSINPQSRKYVNNDVHVENDGAAQCTIWDYNYYEISHLLCAQEKNKFSHTMLRCWNNFSLTRLAIN